MYQETDLLMSDNCHLYYAHVTIVTSPTGPTPLWFCPCDGDRHNVIIVTSLAIFVSETLTHISVPWRAIISILLFQAHEDDSTIMHKEHGKSISFCFCSHQGIVVLQKCQTSSTLRCLQYYQVSPAPRPALLQRPYPFLHLPINITIQSVLCVLLDVD